MSRVHTASFVARVDDFYEEDGVHRIGFIELDGVQIHSEEIGIHDTPQDMMRLFAIKLVHVLGRHR